MDNHIREDSSFSWLVEIQTICREIFSTFRLGKNYEFFFENLQRFECSDEETNKLSDDKICGQCSICIHQFAHRLLGSTTSISECNS